MRLINLDRSIKNKKCNSSHLDACDITCTWKRKNQAFFLLITQIKDT